METIARLNYRVIILGALLLLPISPASARHHPVELPPSSPAWWTLTDEFTPHQLREAHLDREANLQRYLRDLSSGQTQALPEEKARELIFYVNGGAEPELVPLWWAFGAMATVRTQMPFASDDNYRTDDLLLADFGVSAEGVQQILAVAAHHRDLLYERELELEPSWEEFKNFRRRVMRRLGGDDEAERRVEQAAQASDARFLAPLGQQSLAKTTQLLEAVNDDVLLEVAMQSLPELRETLSDSDWNAMRRFFLHFISPSFGSARGFELPQKEEYREAAHP